MSEHETERYGARIPGLDDLPAIPSQTPDPAAGAATEQRSLATAPGAGAADSAADTAGLTERDLDILDFERQWWKHAGAKERAVRDRFGCSPTRYYQALNALLDRPEALEHDPMLVSRLRRLRAARQRARSSVSVRRTGV